MTADQHSSNQPGQADRRRMQWRPEEGRWQVEDCDGGRGRQTEAVAAKLPHDTDSYRVYQKHPDAGPALDLCFP